MPVRPTSWLSRPGLLQAAWNQARLAVRLVREPSVPGAPKALLVLPALYLVFPFDFVPDFIPGLGQLDDLGVILLALQAFVRICPPMAVAFHRRAVEDGRPFTVMTTSDEVIDAEWRRG